MSSPKELPRQIERIAVFVIGIAFLITLLVVALWIENPTPSQTQTFRTIISLAGAAFASLIPGLLEVKYRNFLRASGAIAVFTILYFFSPSMVATNVTNVQGNCNIVGNVKNAKVNC